MPDLHPDKYQSLLHHISDRYIDGQRQATQSVNVHLIETYWEIGRYIIECEQGGKEKARYGEGLHVRRYKQLNAAGIRE